MDVIPESAVRLFEGDQHATVVTLNPDGTPQVSLVWVELDDGEIVFGAPDSGRLSDRGSQTAVIVRVRPERVTGRGPWGRLPELQRLDQSAR